MGEAGRDGGMAFSRHSGARVARTSDVQLHIGESRDSGSTRRRVSRNDGGHRAWLEPENRSRPGQKTPLSSKSCASCGLPLTSRVWPLWFAQPLGSLSGHMRNIITKLLIVVVPRRTAGDG